MANGGSLLDSIRGLFSTSGGGGPDSGARDRDPVRDRVERVEQIATGVEMAAEALADEMSDLRRHSREAAAAVREAARSRVPEEEGSPGGAGGRREAAEALSRSVDALEELHYRLLRIEVHPEVKSDEERDRAADRARESVDRARELAESLTELKPA